MDWFRRNWPDLLIGIALVAVIAGIIATLITGGSFFPVGQNASRTPPPGQSSSVIPGTAAPGSTTQGSSQPGVPTAGGAETTTAPAGTRDDATGASAAPSPGNTGGNPAASSAPGISVLPPADGGSPAASSVTPPAATPAAATPAASSAPSAAATQTAPAGTASSSVASTAGTSADDGPGSDAPYRISVGAFGQLSNAQAQEAAFRAAGYPVFLAEQGDLNIVLVGPYVNEAAARVAADKIRAGGFDIDPVIYRFRGDEDSAPAPIAAASPASTTVVPSTAPAQAQAAPTSAAGQYIQVGAYGSSASAKPQGDRMAAMGYRVTERTEGDLVKLLIGPFDGARVAEVKAQLNKAGIESFVR